MDHFVWPEARRGRDRLDPMVPDPCHHRPVLKLSSEAREKPDSTRTLGVDFNVLGIPRKNLAHRFWAKVDKQAPDECWHWTGAAYKRKKLVYGYLNQRIGPHKTGKTIKLAAHRLSVWLSTGELDVQALVLHSCHNARCVNPAHLRAGTHIENMVEMAEAGRSVKGRRRTWNVNQLNLPLPSEVREV